MGSDSFKLEKLAGTPQLYNEVNGKSFHALLQENECTTLTDDILYIGVELTGIVLMTLMKFLIFF